MSRRRYEIRYDAQARRYLVEVVDEAGQRRYIESCADWESAESLRTHANERLEQAGDYLPERR
jgi:hypothetical protein